MSPLFSFLKKPRQALVSNPSHSFSDDSRKYLQDSSSVAGLSNAWDMDMDMFESSDLSYSLPPAPPRSVDAYGGGARASSSYLLDKPVPRCETSKTAPRYPTIPNVYNFDSDLVLGLKDGPPSRTADDSRTAVLRRSKTRGLRVITATPSKIRLWNTSDIEDQILYELFGVLSSNVNLSKTGTSKHFLLKSGQDSISCVFHEIDKNMPDLLKGQWQRSIGSQDVNGTFRCITIRKATEFELQHLDFFLEMMEKHIPSLLKDK